MSSQNLIDQEVQRSPYDASRYNAVKHGLTATAALLPGEDGALYQARVGVYKRGLKTRNELDEELAGLAAQASWRLERSNRAEVARVSREIITKTDADEQRESLEAIGLEKLLFHDRRGPGQLYPSHDYEHNQPRTSCGEDPDDPHDPAKIVSLMERTRAGCGRLLACWEGLRRILELGLGWQSHEKLRCARLLGKQPLDSIGTPEVAEIFLACHVIEQQFSYAFRELRCEIREDRYKLHKSELERWERAGLVPADATAARAVLLRIIDQETTRLRLIEEKREKFAQALAGLQSDVLSFDETKTGEQLRKHQDRCNRLVLRNIESVQRSHRDEDRGWGRARKEREQRKAGRMKDEGGIESRPFDDRLVMDEQGSVRSAEEYVLAGLDRYHEAEWGNGEPRPRRAVLSEVVPTVPDYARWSAQEEKRKKEEAERRAANGGRMTADECPTAYHSANGQGGEPDSDVPLSLTEEGERAKVQNGIAEDLEGSSGSKTGGVQKMIDPKNCDIASSYDAVSDEYAERVYGELEHKPIDRQLLDRFAARMNLIGPICDMGCGPGHIARYLHDRGAEVMGIDLSRAMVDHARSLNPGIEFRQGDMRGLDVPDEAFGGIAAFYSIIHIPRAEVVSVLGEMKRILRPGGLLLLAFHVGDQILHMDEWWGRHVSINFIFYGVEEMTAFLRSAGLEVGEVVEREPYPEVEHPSRRGYILAEKRQESS